MGISSTGRVGGDECCELFADGSLKQFKGGSGLSYSTSEEKEVSQN